MDSSDDSFPWAQASSSSEDGDGMSAEMSNMQQFETEKKYKKKLHKKLFKDRNEETEEKVKKELLNGSFIKPEPVSDTDIIPHKRKRKREHSSNQELTQNDYLEQRVKQEHHTLPADNSEVENNIDIKETSEKSNYYEDSKSIIDNTIENNSENEHTIIEIKKKKSKKRKDSRIKSTIDGNETDNKANVVRDMAKHIGKNTTESNSGSKKLTLNNKIDTYGVQNNDNTTNHISAINNNVENHCDLTEDDQTKVVKTTHRISKRDSHQTSKLSDLIQFEEDKDIYNNNAFHNDINSQSSQLKRFLKSNPHLCSLQNINKEELISRDDDIWLLNCPKEISITSFKGIDMSLDSKCKVKIDSQTYIGSVKNETGRVAVLMFQHSKLVIANVPLNGTINLRKRIPKAHFVQDTVVANNQTDFIPLPDTKCRHPLFGSDYKKAMKISSSVKARLRISHTEPSSKREKKKKKHKLDASNASESKLEKRARAARKRRHSSDVSLSSKPKRLKHEIDSAEAWDSEKAIENKLFNF